MDKSTRNAVLVTRILGKCSIMSWFDVCNGGMIVKVDADDLKDAQILLSAYNRAPKKTLDLAVDLSCLRTKQPHCGANVELHTSNASAFTRLKSATRDK
jgi:hypothetical protein